MSFNTGIVHLQPPCFSQQQPSKLSYAAVGDDSNRLVEEGNTAPDIIDFHRRFAALPIAS